MDDPTPLATTISKQFAAAWDAPAPHILTALIVGFVIWVALQWRYSTIIERLRDDVAWAERQLQRKPPQFKEASVRDTELTKREGGPDIMAWAEPQHHVIVKQVEKERVFLPGNVTLPKLVKIRQQRSIAVDKQIESYTGKWTRFEGTVENSGIDHNEYFVRIAIGEFDSLQERLQHQVTLWFKATSDYLEAIEPGDTVQGVGMISDITLFGLIITNCELES